MSFIVCAAPTPATDMGSDMGSAGNCHRVVHSRSLRRSPVLPFPFRPSPWAFLFNAPEHFIPMRGVLSAKAGIHPMYHSDLLSSVSHIV